MSPSELRRVGTSPTGARAPTRRKTKVRPADLVAGEAAVLGSCRGVRPIEGTDTWQ